MTAMTAAPDGPEFNGFFRDMFRGGCSGNSCSGGCSGSYAPVYSCYGGGCSGAAAYPAGCSGSGYANNCSGGCNGSGGGFGSRVRRLFERGGCCGGGSGSGYGCGGSGYGCSGSGYGCSGSVGYSCLGASAYSCFGGPVASYTPVVNGGLSCYGGLPLSAPPPVFDPYPGAPAVPGAAPPSSIPYAPPEPAPGLNAQSAGLRPAGYATASQGGGRAAVVVRVPADARLYADSRPLSLTGPERKFVTPELPAGQEFVYRFRVEYERDGETVSVTKRVPVRAGASLSVEFTDLTARATAPERGAGTNTAVATPTSNPGGAAPVVPSVSPAPAKPEPPAAPTVPAPAAPAAGAGDRATITVKLPAGATLYVDDRKSPSAEPVRKFSTPVLPAGREFAYLLRADVVRNGQTESFTQKVPFRAGERVEVDFTGFGR